jgi:hypothetical protein
MACDGAIEHGALSTSMSTKGGREDGSYRCPFTVCCTGSTCTPRCIPLLAVETSEVMAGSQTRVALSATVSVAVTRITRRGSTEGIAR